MVFQATKQYDATLAKLKADKEAAETAKLQVQKESREELERMRTQFSFKVRGYALSFVHGAYFLSLSNTQWRRLLYTDPARHLRRRLENKWLRLLRRLPATCMNGMRMW